MPRLLLVLALLLCSASARAEPYRLRAEAFGQAKAPVGLISLDGRAELAPWATAEAMVWAGRGEFGGEGDALVINVGLRAPSGWGEARLGRMIVATGAIRPVHLDGATLLARLPTNTTLEAFGGSPATPQFQTRGFDWLIGGRISQNISTLGTLGAAYLYRFDDGRPSDQEVGVDFSLTPLDWLDISGRGAYDIYNPGISEAVGHIAARAGDWRFEGYTSYRSAQRILPATSLFTVLGEAAATAVGGRVRWRAAPRLELSASGGGRIYEDDVGEDLNFRARLLTDARGRGWIGIEMTRQGLPGAEWTGARGFARIPIIDTVSASTELELVVPEDSSRGEVWPWGLVALTWRPSPMWEVAAAFEASSTAEYRESYDGLLRLGFFWGSE